jgi:hypothetical protein
MIEHGALNLNYGRKTSVGADRHQQRQRAKLEEDLASSHRRLEDKAAALVGQQARVKESEHKGEGKRLQQRQHTLDKLQDEGQAVQAKQAQLHEQVEALGEAKEPRDRDFRKQTLMTLRTLWLATALLAFIATLVRSLALTISSSCLLPLLFERSGTRVEMAWQVIYEVNGAGLSMPYRHLMTEVIAGLNAMDLRERGKPIQVRLKDRPPSGEDINVHFFERLSKARRTLPFDPLDQSADRHLRGNRDHDRHMISGDMAPQNLHSGFAALFAYDFAYPFGHLTAKNLATILGDPHDMKVMAGVGLILDRKNGVGTMTIIIHGP